MQKDLSQLIKSFKITINNSCLNELFDSYNVLEDCYNFIFDIDSDKCCYFDPSIINLLGYTHNKYLNKGFLFFKANIHPTDFSNLITEIIAIIQVVNNHIRMDNIILPIKMKHKNGNWLKLKIHLIYLQKTCIAKKGILLGFIEKDTDIKVNSSIELFNISSREKEVLKYLAAGNSAKTIAAELFISENTVITHRKNLIQKLKAKNCAELIKKGFEFNILN